MLEALDRTLLGFCPKRIVQTNLDSWTDLSAMSVKCDVIVMSLLLLDFFSAVALILRLRLYLSSSVHSMMGCQLPRNDITHCNGTLVPSNIFNNRPDWSDSLLHSRVPNYTIFIITQVMNRQF